MKTYSKKIDFAKILIEKMLGNENLQFSNSGGKDSSVVYHIIKSMGIQNEIPIIYCNTTVDPKGTIAFIKRNMPETIVLQPKETFFKIIERKGLPTRRARFCCEILKEYASVGKLNIEGVRCAESFKRRGRDYIYCDHRKQMKGCQHIYPIYDFTDEEIWEYIKDNDIELHEWYSFGFKRMGCVGCPQSGKNQYRELSMYPKMITKIKKSIKLGMENNPQWKLTKKSNGNEEKAFAWWISNKSIDEYFQNEFDF